MTENIYDNPYEYEDICIDLCECYEPIFEPPRSFENECKKFWNDYWSKKCNPLYIPGCHYLEDTDGKLYLVCGGELIEVSEHFADNGNTIDQLIKDFIIYKSKQM